MMRGAYCEAPPLFASESCDDGDGSKTGSAPSWWGSSRSTEESWQSAGISAGGGSCFSTLLGAACDAGAMCVVWLHAAAVKSFDLLTARGRGTNL